MSALWPLLGDKLFDSMVAYSGKFKLSGNAFTTTVDTSWVTEWLGTEQLRYSTVILSHVQRHSNTLDFQVDWGLALLGGNASTDRSPAP